MTVAVDGPRPSSGLGASTSGLGASKSLAELLGAALAMTERAAARYRSLAAILTRCRNKPAAELFLMSADDEDAVAQRLRTTARSSGCSPRVPVDLARVEHETVPEADIAEVGGPWLMSRYGALAVAVRKEEQVFGFLTETAAAAVDPAVRYWAERLAKETLDRLAKLRLARRRAHRAEYRPTPKMRTFGQFRQLAVAIETEAARQATTLARRLEAIGDDADAALLDDIAREAAADAASLGEAASRPVAATKPSWRFREVGTAADSQDAIAMLVAALRQVDERYNIYDKLAQTAVEEEAGRQSRMLAEHAVRHLSAIGNRLEALRPR